MDLLGRRRTVLLLVLLALGGLGGLYLYSLAGGPAELPVRDLAGTPLGAFVRTSGLLRDPDPTSTGGLTFALVAPDAPGEVNVFLVPSAYAAVPSPGRLLPGALVQVAGELQEFRGAREVVVTRASDLVVLREAPGGPVPIPYLAQAPWAFRNMTLVVHGRIGGLEVLRGNEGVVGTRFYLSEGNYSIGGVIFGWNFLGDPRGIRGGAAVAFTGVVEYYAPRAQWQLVSDAFSLEPLGG